LEVLEDLWKNLGRERKQGWQVQIVREKTKREGEKRKERPTQKDPTWTNDDFMQETKSEI
jgi:hypothetical protein